jgi:hypothetical protein
MAVTLTFEIVASSQVEWPQFHVYQISASLNVQEQYSPLHHSVSGTSKPL